MSRILYLEPIGGIAGDMFMAAAIDLGVKPEDIAQGLQGLKLDGWKLKVTSQERHHIGGTHVDVELDPSAVVPERSLSDIEAMIRSAGTLSDKVKDRALRVFRAIGEAEAKVHRVPIETIHFHEVGAVDSIVDVCAASLVLELLGEPQVFCAPPPMGSGIVKMAHGMVPVPPPATVEILSGVPVKFEGTGELTTPTGAALVKVLTQVKAPPALTLQKVGYGLGTKDFPDRANVLRASLGEAASAVATQQLKVLEANLDDATPQLIAFVMEQVLERGALDVWVLPATMKKGRPGQLLGVLCEEKDHSALTQLLLSQSTSLGIRSHSVERTALERRHVTVQTEYGELRIKEGLLEGRVLNAHPEYEDCKAAALRMNAPLKQVVAAAQAAYQHAARR